jgi:hypothetical protein
MKHKKKIAATKIVATKAVAEKKISWLVLSCKLMLLLVVAVAAVAYTDSKGYFKSDQTNNHVDRKWKSFYHFTKTKNVDILLLGSSHVITGIDPFILSVATGTSCFILGASGVGGLTDFYFCLENALQKTNPKLVILETYCIDNAQPKEGSIMAKIQSFEARQNTLRKLSTTPILFKSDDWIKAWSPTIRNHSFLLTNRAQIEFNVAQNKTKQPANSKLDLGRFARFETGLEDSTIAKYAELGASVDGSQYELSDYCTKYLQKFMDLCQSKNIPVLFLTVPMYPKHVAHHDIWKARLGEALSKYPDAQWLDLQSPFDSLRFTKDAFENTLDANQHLSNYGMCVAAYKVADFVMHNSAYSLPDRSKEPLWIADFKDQLHFVYNQDVVPNTAAYTSVVKNKTAGDFLVKELMMQAGNDHHRAIIKVSNHAELGETITAHFRVQMHNQIFVAPVQMFSIREILPPLHKVYVADLRADVKVLDVEKIN